MFFRSTLPRSTTFRHAIEADLDRVLPLLIADPASSLTTDQYLAKLADRQYRLPWTWLAEEPDGTLAAVAVWWGSPERELPSALDAVLVVPDGIESGRTESGSTDSGSTESHERRIELAAALLSTAHRAYAAAGAPAPPEYHVFLPGDWREQPSVAAALTWRQEAARRAGLPVAVERLRYEWTPEAGLAAPSGRLRFTAEPDDEVFVDLFRRALTGTLDAASGKEAAELGAEAQARADVAFYRDDMVGDRAWWRVARTEAGEAVGFGLPSRNHVFPVVGYLGVLPEHRGRGYVDEILTEITRILAAEAAPEVVRADTDLTNAPMAAAFERVGYRNNARRLVLSAR
ncbi:GNAT family N-acetyltransferase [Kitasatospora sp. NBC_01287]|uniref:GNAT family N-acetyltransferase n=1 Tax=Kitasatospora sp. NBC_01287 TaxID=2903573 RepID=UPI0022562339|nr:GNAT family N-acetyltransferase [Kitasatospora sp. NBC_01287]MCX4744487.1 GNAT family N-acetyltransferase [Kitasatospora sp. NBC_01287]